MIGRKIEDKIKRNEHGEIVRTRLAHQVPRALPSNSKSWQGDLTQLYSQISRDISGARNRDACVKAIQERAYSRVRQRRNVMVFNLSQNYSKNLKNATFKQFRCAGTIYGLWTFTSGKFINKGDGGYINWAFAGNFRRTGKGGKIVTFLPIRR